MYFPLGVPPLIELFFLPFFHFKDKLTSVFGKKKKRLITCKTRCLPIGNCLSCFPFFGTHPNRYHVGCVGHIKTCFQGLYFYVCL